METVISPTVTLGATRYLNGFTEKGNKRINLFGNMHYTDFSCNCCTNTHPETINLAKTGPSSRVIEIMTTVTAELSVEKREKME